MQYVLYRFLKLEGEQGVSTSNDVSDMDTTLFPTTITTDAINSLQDRPLTSLNSPEPLPIV
jgi:hypothetical protein